MLWNMCFVNEETNRKRLLNVAACGQQGIHAYNVDRSTLEWIQDINGMEQAGVA